MAEIAVFSITRTFRACRQPAQNEQRASLEALSMNNAHSGTGQTAHPASTRSYNLDVGLLRFMQG